MGKLADLIKRKPSVCAFGEMVERYAEDDADRESVMDPNSTAVSVWRAACDEWGQIGLTTIKDHRKRVCSCFRTGA